MLRKLAIIIVIGLLIWSINDSRVKHNQYESDYKRVEDEITHDIMTKVDNPNEVHNVITINCENIMKDSSDVYTCINRYESEHTWVQINWSELLDRSNNV